METIKTISAMRDRIRKARWTSTSSDDGHERSSCKIGLVPTMGALHDGHASLMLKARSQCDFVVLSVFVNPLQFAPNEDYEAYPRNIYKDVQLAKKCDVDVVFAPDVGEMYPDNQGVSLTKVSVAKLTEVMCGRCRPMHFDGSATVVTKLLNIVQPDAAYFGLKDAQQVAIIQQMVTDLNIPVEIVACPTIRETTDDLAMSSRNAYLTLEDRRQAQVIPSALNEVVSRAVRPEATLSSLMTCVRDRISSVPSARLDYVEIVYYPSMRPVHDLEVLVSNADGPFIVALAVKIGKAKLIDNRIIDPKNPF